MVLQWQPCAAILFAGWALVQTFCLFCVLCVFCFVLFCFVLSVCLLVTCFFVSLFVCLFVLLLLLLLVEGVGVTDIFWFFLVAILSMFYLHSFEVESDVGPNGVPAAGSLLLRLRADWQFAVQPCGSSALALLHHFCPVPIGTAYGVTSAWHATSAGAFPKGTGCSATLLLACLNDIITLKL